MTLSADEKKVEPCTVDDELLALLACPVPECRAALRVMPGFLTCTRCGLRYRCEEKWPTLIPEEALPPVEATAHEE